MPDTTAKCEFCGKPLDPRSVEFAGKSFLVGFASCDCPQAVAKADAEAKADDERKRQAEIDAFYRRLEQAGVPKRYLRSTHPLEKQLAAKVDQGQSLYIHGDNGTLKTTLASAIVRNLVYRGKRVLMANSVDMLIEVQSTYGTPNAEADVLSKYGGAPYLVIDDLGKEQQTAWTASRLYAVLNARYNAMLPTVITSNFRVSEIASRMSGCDESTAKAIASRLAGMCEAIATGGEDRRLS